MRNYIFTINNIKISQEFTIKFSIHKYEWIFQTFYSRYFICCIKLNKEKHRFDNRARTTQPQSSLSAVWLFLSVWIFTISRIIFSHSLTTYISFPSCFVTLLTFKEILWRFRSFSFMDWWCLRFTSLNVNTSWTLTTFLGGS